MTALILEPYPEWKRTLWRFVRVFIAGGLLAVTITTDSLQSVESFRNTLFLPFLTAGLVAVAKVIRDAVEDRNPELYKNLIKFSVV